MVGNVDLNGDEFLGLEKIKPRIEADWQRAKAWIDGKFHHTSAPVAMATRDISSDGTKTEKSKLQEVAQTVTDWLSGLATGAEVVNKQYINNEDRIAADKAAKEAKEAANKKAGNMMLYGSIAVVLVLIIVFVVIKKKSNG